MIDVKWLTGQILCPSIICTVWYSTRGSFQGLSYCASYVTQALWIYCYSKVMHTSTHFNDWVLNFDSYLCSYFTGFAIWNLQESFSSLSWNALVELFKNLGILLYQWQLSDKQLSSASFEASNGKRSLSLASKCKAWFHCVNIGR